MEAKITDFRREEVQEVLENNLKIQVFRLVEVVVTRSDAVLALKKGANNENANS